jgi:serine/threonine protein phosphatase PrpC
LHKWTPLSPPIPHRLRAGTACGATDVGLVRVSNQDNFLIAPELNLLLLADGMGGHDGGDIASTSALLLVRDFLLAAEAAADGEAAIADPARRAMLTLRDAVDHANTVIHGHNRASGRAEGAGMGTTLTGIWQPLAGGPLLACHVGDSRLYRSRAGKLSQLTRDQTLYQQAIDDGARASLPARNVLLQAVGPGANIRPELQMLTTQPGDVYLLCSDGLYGDSSEAQTGAIVAAARDDNLDACCAALLAMALHDGGSDNITALLLRCPD